MKKTILALLLSLMALPTLAAEYTVTPAQWDWMGNYRLLVKNVTAADPTVVHFTVASQGKKALVQIGAENGFNGTHVMTLGGVTKTSQTPAFQVVSGPTQYGPKPCCNLPIPVTMIGLEPNSVETATINTQVPVGKVVSFHINFQNSGN